MARTAEAPGKVDAAPPGTRPATPGTKPDQDTQEQVVVPYRVILHNDEVNYFGDVVRYVHQLTPLSPTEAQQRVHEAHRQGRSVLLTTHRERAELYVEQFASVRLTVTIEPDA